VLGSQDLLHVRRLQEVLPCAPFAIVPMSIMYV
jgi:hypothetical protein